GRRQLTVDQQVGRLDEGGLLGELLDRVAAVAQDARVTVDVGDGGLARGRVDEADVEGDVAGLLHQLRDLVGVVALGGRDQGESQLLVTRAKYSSRCVVRHVVPSS